MTVRILAVCGNGQGSSMIMKMKVDQFLTQSNIDHTVNSCAVGEYKSELNGADIIIASTHIAGEISVSGNKYVVGWWRTTPSFYRPTPAPGRKPSS